MPLSPAEKLKLQTDQAVVAKLVTAPKRAAAVAKVTADINALVPDPLPAPPPTVTQVSPRSGPIAGGESIVITGANFVNVVAVRFGATPATSVTVNSAAQITAVAPPEGAGMEDITVATTAGVSAVSPADLFDPTAPPPPPPAPSISTIGPSSGPTTGGTSVNITGANLTGATAVMFGAVPAESFVVNSASSITAIAPVESAEEVDVIVTTPSGTSSTGLVDKYTYFTPTPPPSGLNWHAPTNMGSALTFPVSGVPNDYYQISTTKAFNIFDVGDPIQFTLARGSGATGYEVRDHAGNLLGSGPITAGANALALANPGKFGSFLLRLQGPTVDANFGDGYGDCWFHVWPNNPNYPAIGGYKSGFVAADPPAGLSVGDPNPFNNGSGGNANSTLAAFTDSPYRLGFPPPPTGTTQSTWVAWAQALATGYKQQIGIDQVSGWLSIKPDGVRTPRIYTAAFSGFSGSAADVAAVTAAVQILGTEAVYEGYNEPNTSMSPQTFFPIHQAFYAAVKAGNPEAQVAGPCTVTMNNVSSGWLATFLGLKPNLDAWTSHPYNSIAQGNMWLGDECMGKMVAALTQFGYENLPRFCTEYGGMFMADYGPYFPLRQLADGIRGSLQMERWGIPIQNQDWFYECDHGFWAQPSWLANAQINFGEGGQDMNPICMGRNQLSIQLRGKVFSEDVPLGGASDFMRAYAFTGPTDGTSMVALFSAGPSSLSVTVESSGTITATDVMGNAVPMANGQVTVTALPTYVNSTAPITVTDVDNGLMTAVDLIPGYGVASVLPSMSQTNVARITAGTITSSYVDDSDDDGNSPYTDLSNVANGQVTITLPKPTVVARIAPIAAPAWHQQTTPVQFKVEVQVGGVWADVLDYLNPTATSIPFVSVGTGCTAVTWFDGAWMFPFQLKGPMTITGIRYTGIYPTFGDSPDVATSSGTASHQGCPQRTVSNGIRAYAT